MPSEIFDDVIFPDQLVSAAARGRKRWRTAVGVNQGGFETRNGLRTQPVREYELGLVPRPVSEWAAIDDLHDIVRGSLYGFLLRDPTNNSCTLGNGLLRALPASLRGQLGAPGVGYGVPSYRLLKRATAAVHANDRDIRRPDSGTVYRNGAPVTVGAGAGNISAVDVASGGTVTFVADSTSNVTAVTVGATTQVQLAVALPGLLVGGRLYLSGLTGADAGLLNQQSHAISGIAGTVYTLSTNTASKTITAAGTGRKYPQPTDTLAWAGTFYVPVRFEEDDIDWAIVAGHPTTDRRLVQGPSVLLREILLP